MHRPGDADAPAAEETMRIESPIRFECPTCGAKPGERCRSEVENFVHHEHFSRKVVAYKKTVN